jgi:hypothetical protein
MFPPFVLAKIYVQGSLKNTPKGFEFNLKNVVDSGTLVELGPITVDGKAYEAADLTIMTGMANAATMTHLPCRSCWQLLHHPRNGAASPRASISVSIPPRDRPIH